MNIHFYTLGCKVNQYETQAMREEFLFRGFTDYKEKPADIVLINSCSVTAESERKARQLLNKIKRTSQSLVVLTGCMVQAYPEESKKLNADLIIGNGDVKTVVDKTEELVCNSQKMFSFKEHFKGEEYNTLPISRFDERTRAYMKIEDGCDRFCSYCVIPYARGRVRSRSLESIKAEAQRLADNGYLEVVLVGINLSAYGKGTNYNICDAVEVVCGIDKIKRIRLGSLEPDHITDQMLSRLSSLSKFCPQFHLSLQSGCNETLKRMNRHYDTAFYYDLITRIRQNFKDASITTDIMVGFAGETEEEFNKSLAFAKKAEFARAHIFPYSIRTGTVAEKFGDQVTSAEKERRSKLMITTTKQSESDFLKKLVGKTVAVLFEKNNEGYTENYSRVVLTKGDVREGEIKDVLITESFADYCNGIII